jgi:hypothetical protein
MKKMSSLSLKLMLVLGLLVSLLSGCGAPNVKETYPLESVNRDGSSTSYVYRAVNTSVPEVASALISEKKPDQASPESTERMFLVYGSKYYHLQQDPKNTSDTLIEISSKEYVKRNYSSSFLQGYLASSLLRDLFDSLGRGGNYRGYTSKDIYKPSQGNYHKPTDADKKISPPLTVERKGNIFRRGKDSDSSSVGSNGSWFNRDSGSSKDKKGKIERKKGGSSSSGWFDSPKIKKPKTRKGTGSIFKRRR